MNEEIVRFIMVRPPEPSSRQLLITATPPLQKELDAAATAAAPAEQLAAAAGRRRAALTVQPGTRLPFLDELGKLAALLRKADTAADGQTAVAKVFGPDAPAARREMLRTVEVLEDLVICRKYAGRSGADDREEQEALRAALVMKHPAFTSGPASPRDMMAWPLVVAAAPRVVPAPLASPSRPEHPAPDVEALREEIARHQATLAELEEFTAQDFEEDDDDKVSPPESRRRPGHLLSATARTRLSGAALQVLAARKVNLETDDVLTVERNLAGGLLLLEQQRAAIERRLDPPPVIVRMAGSHYEISPAANLPSLPDLSAGLPPVPGSHGDQIPVGVGDLLVVRQQLTGYEAADISHVDNAMQGEHRSREHKRGRITEQTTSEEIETLREEEKDQQSTDRNEMKRETANALSEQLSMKLATSLSGSYGPAVQFSMNAGMAMESAKEASSSYAQTISKEATQRAATKVSERIKRTSTLRITESVEETNIHEIDNKTGTGHVTGIYQWLDKVHEAAVFNYGVRMMFDLMLPEPAALLLQTAAEQPAAGARIQKPIPFNLTADQIHEWNYTVHAQTYDAGGLEPPPDRVRTVSKVLGAVQAEDSESHWTQQTADLPIPEGYEAHRVRVATAFGAEDIENPNVSVEAVVGGVRLRLHKAKLTASKNLSNEQGSLSIAMHSFNLATVVVTVTVDCRRTKRAVSAWRLATHAAIKQGYLKQLQDYEVKLARAKAEAAAVAEARMTRPTPELIQNELKRAAISVLTRQHFSLFNSITETKALPLINFEQLAAEGPYIRFFEQAFEWEQASHVFYPYFWGRRKLWKARLALGADDPEFAQFLKAGAARLVLPVRREFENGILHFLETGQVWQGGEPPEITSPQYVHIVDEIREQTGAPGAEVPVGKPWTVRLPTTLIKIRQQSTLPAWGKQQDGSWAPVD